jgi:hypothetical protein
MEDQQYKNPFVEVHEKARAFRDRAREANEKDKEIRENRVAEEAQKLPDFRGN